VSVSEAQPVTAGNQTIEAVALSPDGKWLAFDSDRSGNQDIYKMPVSGGEPVRLTTHPGDDFMSSWSPNGREIAFAEYDSGTRLVKVMSADGGTSHTVTKRPPGQGFPGWSPDGKSLVFHSGASGRIQLYVVSRRADSSWGQARQLTRDGGVRGRWSPDGRQIVYTNDDGVWLISPNGGQPRPLVRIENRGAQPVPDVVQWSPDGRTIYYQALDSQGHTSFWSVPAAGGAPRLLVRFDVPDRQSNRPEFTTDGKRFFFTIGHRESDVWTMELTPRR
jgi:Tol biopolymer transport system component